MNAPEVIMMKCVVSAMLILIATSMFATEPVGKWTFNNANDLLHADIGTDLTLTGTETAVPGPNAGNGAIRIGPGSFFRCYHGIPANGGGSWVNEYSLYIDFKVPTIGQWYCFLQTSYTNSNDGDAFVNTSGQVGVAQTGYSAYTLVPDEWYRLVISADLGSSYKYYLDGQLLQDGGNQALDGRFSLYPMSNNNQVLFFADDNGEDNLIDVAEVRLYDVPLSATEISSLGGYGHNVGSGPASMLPFLQSPTPSSIYVSWHCATAGTSQVFYGTNPDQLTQTDTATSQNLAANIIWHTSKLENLTPNMKYYYRCQTGTDTSAVCSFVTPPLPGTTMGILRFIIVGDSQTNASVSSWVVSKIEEKCVELYGQNWRDTIDLIAHVGDTVGNGTVLSSYAPEFFVPFSPLSKSIPIMVSIGNHEAGSTNYYNYMNYQDFGGPEGEKYYSLDIAGSRFIFLNGNIATTQQLPWLQQKLDEAAADTGIRNIFTFIHQPGHSEVWPDGNYTWTQNSVIPLLESNPKAVLIASGHSHNYEHGTSRTSRLRHFVCGGAGGDLDRWGMYANQTDYPETHISLDHYHWMLVEVDLTFNQVYGRTFSLGNTDRPRNNDLVDSWVHNGLGAQSPLTPYVIGTAKLPGNRLQVTLSPYADAQEAQFSIGGEISSNSSFSNILGSVFNDLKNVYGDSGAPLWEPIDLNANPDHRRIIFDTQNLSIGNNYWLRAWYRDSNLDKSGVEPIVFTNFAYEPFCDFTADQQYVFAGEPVQFIDLSGADISAWAWDFDDNGTTDSTLRDPVFYYSEPGCYNVTLQITTELGPRFMAKEGLVTVGISDAEDNVSEPPVRVLNCYPNPFSQSSSVYLSLKEPSALKAEIFNQRGQMVRTLFDGYKSAGAHTLQFDGRADSGEKLPSGVYLFRVSAPRFSTQGKLMLLK